MNYIVHLNTFLARSVKDTWLKPNHHIIYMTLFHLWNRQGFKNTINICRDKIMNMSKITSKKTYYDCIAQLESGGYLKFYKSTSRFTSATVTMIPLIPQGVLTGTSWGTEQVLQGVLTGTSEDIQQVPAEVPIYKLTSKEKINEGTNRPPQESVFLDEVKSFFIASDSTEIEAMKFWYYYESVEWHLAGRKISRWKALAKKWLLEAHKIKTINGPIYTNIPKDYQEPF